MAESREINVERQDIHLANGRTISFEIARQPGRGAFFILGVRKSGSSILNAMCGALARFNNYKYVDVAGTMFNNNLTVESWSHDPVMNEVLAEGNVYGGFRAMPFAYSRSSAFLPAKKVLLVRDPRDALVSEYFSNAYSHAIPAASGERAEVSRQMSELRQKALETNIEDSVLSMAPNLNRTILGYSSVCKDATTLLLKYEDVILDKRGLIGKICTHFGWNFTEQLVTNILGWADVIPSSEDKKAFVRKVVPGDHKEKLSKKTISRLNKILKPAMDLVGYDPV
jgi:hypothetical protein